ncbi:MAG: prepilin-type N-terminal cleavage/methylation domain-containing protein [bacterium]
MQLKNKLKKGLTLIETLVSIAVLMIVLVIGITFITYISKESKDLKEKAFAILKANQILSEVRNYVDSNKEALNLKYLDNFNDSGYNPFLTIENVSNPLIAPSENKRQENNYIFYRRIRVYPLPNRPNSDNVRVLEVSIFKRENNGNFKFLTSATTIINTLANFSPSTQAYDIYFLSIGTVPGWWVFTPEIRKVVDYVISDLEDRNNGLKINPHFITTMAYGGRDPYYSPFIGERINSPNDGTPLDSPFVYYLAGTSFINSNPSLPFRYNTFNLITGYINKKTEADLKKTFVYPYSIADQYNHAVRYPQELRNYQKIVEYAKANNLPEPELSYRMLIEKLYTDPAYQNSIIINLHGELMPILPVRNYSDPAKLPYISNYYPIPTGQETKYKNIRVVVHPENIAYPDTSIPNYEDITLRVYAYQLNPNANILPNDRIENITLLIGPLNSSNYTITGYAIDGGVQPIRNDYIRYNINSTNITASETIVNLSGNLQAMYLKAKIYQKDGKNYLAILLKNTPTKCSIISNNKGLPSNQRLYGLEYIPFMFPFGGFRELDDNNNLPKNTARWVITIKNVEKTQDVNNPLEIKYTIDPAKSGGDPIIYPNFNYDFPDYSQSTYVWVCRNLNEIPITEQFQVLGDPRLCPYKDVVQQMRYNKYFAYPSGTNLYTIKQQYFNNNYAVVINDGYPSAGGYISIDIPASFYIIREALGKSHSIFNSITGFSFYYVGIGQEIGGDSANNLPNGVPVSQSVFQNGNGVINGEQSIITENGLDVAGFGVKNIVRLTNNNWGGTSNPNSSDYVAWGNFAIPFLNEIFPDNNYQYWKQNGNLNNNEFKKRRWRDSLSTNFSNNQVVRTGVSGCTSFFNAVPAGSAADVNQWFNHGWGNSDSLAAHKQEIVNDMETAFNFSLPSDITSARPFQINLNFQGRPPEWDDNFYKINRFYNSIYTVYYNHNGANGANLASAIIRSTKQDGGRTYHWVVVNGLSPQGSEAQSFVARYSIMSSLYAFLLAGNDTNANVFPIPMIPYLNITNPTNTQEINTNNINITWNISFKRWDGNPYVPGFNVSQNPNNYFYLIKYQKLGDNKWYFVQDINRSFPCDIGDLPSDNSYKIYATNYNWDISNLPNDMYWLVVEAHHNLRVNHYSYHMVFINVNK